MSNRYPGGFITLDEPTVNSTSAKGVWTLDQQADYQGQGVWPTSMYQISRSLRFNSADSAYLSRTPASAGDRTAWTFSFWVKRSTLGTEQHILSTSTLQFFFNTSNALILSENGGGFGTSQVFRDVNAWMHIIIVWDSDNATSTDRVRLYVNGLRVTALASATYPTLGGLSYMNQASLTYIGEFIGGGSYYLSSYLADVHFIDGQALTPSSFGETDATTGVWKPIRYAGTYGTNGFKLSFSDSSNTTAATLGADSSGNGNNWTPNNFSVTAGAGNDSLVDSPTQYGTDTGAGGEVRGNYATFNSTIPALTNQATTVISNGNLDFSETQNNGNIGTALSTIGVSSGKWYFEYLGTNVRNQSGVGFINAANLASFNGASYGFATPSDGFYRGISSFSTNATTTVTGLTTFVDGNIMMCAVDFDAGKMWFGINGTWDNSGNPGAGTNQLATFTPDGKTFLFGVQGWSTSGAVNGSVNFGARPFAYTAPSGFKALCTTNLPDPTVLQGDDYFNTVLYTGTGASQSITGVGFQPDFVWIKNRVAAYVHVLFDVVRGSSSGYFNKLVTSTTAGESLYAQGAFGAVTALNSDGFTVDSSNSDWNQTNASGSTYVAWNWKANGAGVSNTDGTITSTVSANTTAGISIVTFTTPAGATDNFSVGHGLGVAPKMVIIKSRASALDWWTWHIGLGDNTTDYLALNLTSAEAGASRMWGTVGRNSTVIGMGNGVSTTASNSMVAYCFAEVEGFSKFGSFVGNGSADGPFIYTGFRPAFVITRVSSQIANWFMFDSKRGAYNPSSPYFLANTSDAETANSLIDLCSNGFKMRTTSTFVNPSSQTIIYMAFAENPFKYALAR